MACDAAPRDTHGSDVVLYVSRTHAELAARDRRVARLFAEHSEAVRARAGRHEPGLADDVVSETFATALRRHASIPAGHERAWLFVVADHVLRNQRRSVRRAAALADVVRSGAATSHPPVELPVVGAALSTLSPRERQLVTMTGLEGLSMREAADRLGIAPGTAMNTMVGARRRLARSLAALGLAVGSIAFGLVFTQGAQAHAPVATASIETPNVR